MSVPTALLSRRFAAALLAFAICGLPAVQASAETPGAAEEIELSLARKGVSGYMILISSDASGPVRNAAEIFREHFRRITGAWIPIVRVGSIPDRKQLPEKAFIIDDAASGGGILKAAGFALPEKELSYDGLYIDVKGERVLLSGAAERGAMYAVADFLEREMGCRFYAMDRRIVPRDEDLTVRVRPRLENPSFSIRWLYLTRPRYVQEAMWYLMSRNTNTFYINRIGEDLGEDPYNWVGGPHAFYQFLPPHKYFDEHPEWYSWRRGSDGEGVRFHFRGQFDYFAEGLDEDYAVEAARRLAQRPEISVVSATHGDWFGWSEDPNTNAFDVAHGRTPAASHVDFVNRVARHLKKLAPDATLATLAYLHTQWPPEGLTLEDNTRVVVCNTTSKWSEALSHTGLMGEQFFEIVDRWCRISPETFVWLYLQKSHGYCLISPDVAALDEDFRRLHASGVSGIFAETSVRGFGDPMSDLRNYLINKLFWDVDLDVEALLEDFHTGYYGPQSGPKMLEFYRLAAQQTTWDPRGWPEETLLEMRRIAEQALEVAEDSFARRQILVALRAIARMRLCRRTADWQYSDGRLANEADTPEVRQLIERFNALSERIGPEDDYENQPRLLRAHTTKSVRQESLDQYRLDMSAERMSNGEITLTVVPKAGGAVVDILDARSGRQYAARMPWALRWAGRITGGYQAVVAGIRTLWDEMEIVEFNGESATFEAVSGPMRWRRTIRLVEGAAAFTVETTATNISKKTERRALRTHPMVTVSREIEDARFCYLDGEGRFHSDLPKGIECLSAGWGPTGLWMLANPAENLAICWTSDDVHNGHFTWAAENPRQAYVGCETFTAQTVLEPGESYTFTERFEIVRDLAGWCAERGVAVPQ